MIFYFLVSVHNGDDDAFVLLFTTEHEALCNAYHYWRDIGPIQRRHRKEFYVCRSRCTPDLNIDFEDPDFVVIKDFVKECS